MKKLYLILALLTLSGCTTSVTHMGLIVPQSTHFEMSAINQARVVKNVRGEDSSPILLFIALGQPNFEKAVQDTIAKGKGNALINAKVSNISQWFILFGVNKIVIDADVVNIPNN